MKAFTVVDCEQKSPEWFAARVGRLTSTGAADMLAKIQKGEAAGRRNLRARLMLEQITGRSQERNDFQTQAMRDGNEREPDAAAVYEAITGEMLSTTGFLSHNSLMAGASLDGHIGDFDGIVEIKSPIAATHLDYLRSGTVPDNYLKQVTHALWISGAAWCDWLSYQPDFPEALRVKVIRIDAKSLDLEGYERDVRAFLAEVAAEVESVRTMADLSGVMRQAVAS